MSSPTAAREFRASNGIHCRVVGDGEPLLLLHGLMVTGAMFDTLVAHLQDKFRMLIPDLRGHGKSGAIAGPHDVAALAGDLEIAMSEANFDRASVMGYSHGGAVAQQFARIRPQRVQRLMLTCTYACNASTRRERIEAEVLSLLLRVFNPGTIASLVVHGSRPGKTGAIGLTKENAAWLRAMMAENRARPMRSAARGLVTFDSRPWLGEIKVPTLVVSGSHDTAVPRHHHEALVRGIPGAVGRLVDRARHTLIWTHTRELADIIHEKWPRLTPPASATPRAN